MITIRNSVSLFSYQVCIPLLHYFDIFWLAEILRKEHFRFQRQDGLTFSFWWISRDTHQIIIKSSADKCLPLTLCLPCLPPYQAPQLTLSRDAPQWEMPHNVPWGHWWLMVNGQAKEKTGLEIELPKKLWCLNKQMISRDVKFKLSENSLQSDTVATVQK